MPINQIIKAGVWIDKIYSSYSMLKLITFMLYDGIPSVFQSPFFSVFIQESCGESSTQDECFSFRTSA